MSLTDFAFCVALLLVVAGVAVVYWPAALVVAGALLARLTVYYERGSSDGKRAGR